MRELLIITSALIFLIGACALVFISWNTWLAKRDQARMVRDRAFGLWLDRVEARLHQYGANRLDRTLADWLIDFESGLSPDLAAKNMLGASKRAPR